MGSFVLSRKSNMQAGAWDKLLSRTDIRLLLNDMHMHCNVYFRNMILFSRSLLVTLKSNFHRVFAEKQEEEEQQHLFFKLVQTSSKETQGIMQI